MSSTAGRSGSAKQSACSASKAGIVGFSRSLAEDVAYLARDGAAFITGQAYSLDGGVVAG